MAVDAFIDDVKEITSLNDLKAFKEAVQANYTWLENSFTGKNADELVVARSNFTDELLCHAWKLLSLHTCSNLSLCAVGGYGRGQLQPYSDIDLLVLSKKVLSASQQETVSQFITFLWDIKLEIGQSVRTIKETIQLAKADITIATNLVEARLLCGCSDTFDALMKKAIGPRTWSSKLFFKAKLDEQINRHRKFDDTSYNLEPNIKENPGCLRDIQSIGWVAKKHFQEYDGTTLIGHGYFTKLEHAELIECRSELWQIRFALHIIAGRSENRLLFDYQPQVAERLGYGENKAAVEKLMKHLFRIVQRVSELNSMLLQRFSSDILGQSRKKLYCFNQDFCMQDGKLIPQHDNCFPSPISILNFLDLLAQNPEIKGLDGNCIRQLRNARRQFQSAYYHEYEDCREKFIELVSTPDFFDLGWDIMHLHGILRAYLPQWDNIVGMMQFDLFHAYTVDEHTHRLVKYVRRYYKEKEEFPRCSRIVHELDEPQILFIAAIFHDIAKGRGGDHSKLGAKDVFVFCEQHNISEKNTNMIAWLVENHLLMSVVAQRRDIYDPDVVKEFASEVKSQLHLELLYALTLADIRATNNNLWNDWKASLLRELYLLTKKALDNGLQCQNTLEERIVTHKSEAAIVLEQLEVNEEDYLPFWSRMNDNYFARFKPAQIAWHSQVITSRGHQLLEKDVIVAASNFTSRAGTELLIYCHDRPALFAQIASVLDSRNCSIHDAQIVVTSDGYVFDSMIILDENSERISTQPRADNIAKAVHQQLVKPGRSHSNKRRMSRQMRQLDVPTKVRFFDIQDGSTLIELEALDAPGLLAKIGHLFVDLNITLKMAKITTIGERAEDVFIISNADGETLTQEQKILLRKQLKIKLDQPEVNTAI